MMQNSVDYRECDFLVSIHQKQQQKMPLSTVLLTYDLDFADSHLLLGTAVFK